MVGVVCGVWPRSKFPESEVFIFLDSRTAIIFTEFETKLDRFWSNQDQKFQHRTRITILVTTRTLDSGAT